MFWERMISFCVGTEPRGAYCFSLTPSLIVSAVAVPCASWDSSELS